MQSKLILIAGMLMWACHYVHGRHTAQDLNQELMETEKSQRTFVEVPFIGTVIMVAFKIFGLVMNCIGPFLQYILAAFTLIGNVASWLHQNYFSVILGSAVILGFGVITGTFAQVPELEMDHRLILAARQLEAGAVKYARMIN